MNRQEFLVKSGLFLAALTLTPSRASALGGVVLETGTTVPDFDLPGSSQSEPDRKRWSSRDLHGRWLAVYFYPRDFTGGCTIEARGFESLHDDFLRAGAEVIGISADSVDDHESFCESEGLSFPLLSDPDGTVSKAYGSWMAPYSLRHTFLIDEEGKLERIYLKVKAATMADTLISDLGLS